MNYEKKVLETVKKYPTYSVTKLNEMLPDIKRHKIQTILEKKRLSRLEDRLAFSQRNNGVVEKKVEQKADITDVVSKLRSRIGSKVRINITPTKKKWIGRFGLAAVLSFSLWFATIPKPDISISNPGVNVAHKGNNLYVSGWVKPRASKVRVNDELVSINGNGEFTAVIEVPLGESVLYVDAYYWGRRASLLRVVERQMTEEEAAAKAMLDEEGARKVQEKAAVLERRVNDLMAVKSGNTQEAAVRVITSSLEEDEGYVSVVGEVGNFSDTAVSFVQVTASFLNENGGIVDRMVGFATGFGEVLEPGEQLSFETLPTMAEFVRYNLDVEWVVPEVAGASDEATPSAEVDEFSSEEE